MVDYIWNYYRGILGVYTVAGFGGVRVFLPSIVGCMGVKV